MGRYWLKFSYIGTLYRGMQKNTRVGVLHDSDTIQGALEAALYTIKPKPITPLSMTLSSRTDAGVHALCSTAHVDLQNEHEIPYNTDELIKSVNRFLVKCKHSIRLLECIPVTEEFSSRRMVKCRTYVYRFIKAKHQNEHRIPIIDYNHCFHVRSDTLDIERMKRATQLFVGEKDFRTFAARSKPELPAEKYRRKIEILTLERAEPFMPLDPLCQNYDYWQFTVVARSFLYNQVRRMVASLLALGMDRVTERDIQIMLQVPGHHNWNSRIHLVPPQGLHLARIDYDLEEVEKCIIKQDEDPTTVDP